MECVGGGTLRGLLERFGPLPMSMVRRYTRHITRGLAFVHSQGIIHRDVKGVLGRAVKMMLDEHTYMSPSPKILGCNVLIGADGTAKLADFGAAGVLRGPATMSAEFQSSHGTPAFMAPEMIRGENIGRAADIWSLGCVVIQMASGQLPWSELEACNAFALMYRIAGDASALPVLPPSLPEAGREFVLRCLQRDPDERPTAVCLLMHPFLDR